MAITLPKTEALSDLKFSLKQAAKDGKLTNVERANIRGRAAAVMETLNTQPQLDLLVDKIDASIKPLKYDGYHGSGYGSFGATRQDFLGILQEDVTDRVATLESDAAIDTNFP